MLGNRVEAQRVQNVLHVIDEPTIPLAGGEQGAPVPGEGEGIGTHTTWTVWAVETPEANGA